jgi:hypothetical protein
MAVALAGTLVVHASWSVPGVSSVHARAAAMPRGEKPTVTKQAKAAVVSWDRQEIAPGSPMDHYVVTAHHDGDGPARPDITRTVQAGGTMTESVTFTADAMAGGTWHWTVTPKFCRWIGTESKDSKSLTFPAGPAARSVSPAPTSTSTSEPVAKSPTPTAQLPSASTEATAGRPEPSMSVQSEPHPTGSESGGTEAPPTTP